MTRVNPKATLAEIYNMVCEEKNMDMYKYELRHPTTPDEALNMASPLEAYGLTEIVVVHIGGMYNQNYLFSLSTRGCQVLPIFLNLDYNICRVHQQ